MSEKVTLQHPFNILLVEDNEDDVWLTKRAFQRLSVTPELYTASDGVDALKFLRREEPYTVAPLPDIILLDLNMPGMDGRQLLAELKRDENLKTIPAIVLSTSDAEHDVREAYAAHANAYLTKPLLLQEFSRRIQCFVDFWLDNVAILPSDCDSRRFQPA